MAISSSISLRSISDSVSSTKRSTKETKNTAINLSKLLSKNISTKRNLWSNIKSIKQKRIERENRNVLRDRLAAPIIAIKPRGPRLLSASDSSTSITDRLLGFVGYLTAGWILGNLPTWISLGEQFSERIKLSASILTNYGDELITVISNVGNVFNAGFQNISKFDFSDSSYLVRSSLNELKLSIDELGEGISDAFNVLIQPFKELEKIPDAYGQLPSTIPGLPPTPAPGAPSVSGGNADFWLLALISLYENSSPQGAADVAQSIYNRMRYSGRNARQIILSPNQYEPVGKFGSVSAWNKVVDRETAIAHIKKYPGNGASSNGLDKVSSALTNKSMQQSAARFVGNRPDFRSEGFEKSYNDMTNDTTRHGQTFGFNRGSAYLGKSSTAAPVPNLGAISAPTPSASPADFLSQFGSPAAAILSLLTGGKSGQRRLQKGDIFTRSLGRGVDFIQISSLVGDGRNHGGIDIAAPYGTYIALRVDCEVVAQGPYGAYGTLIDVWIPSLGIQLRLAHLSSVIIKTGRIPAGTSFARVGTSGRVTGPHIHLEYDTKKGTRGGGAINDDPNYAAKLDQYVRLLFLTDKPVGRNFSRPSQPLVSMKPAAATIAMQTTSEVDMEGQSYLAGVLDGVKQERTGRKIVVVDDRQASTPQVVVASAEPSGIDLSVSESFLVNNFMRNKLLSDLSYV